MWICDNCLEINEEDANVCKKCGEDRPPQKKLKEEIAESQGVVPTVAQAPDPRLKTLFVGESTNSSPETVRAILIGLSIVWAFAVVWLIYLIATTPAAPPTSLTGTDTGFQSKIAKIIRLVVVLALPVIALFIPTTRWEFDPASNTLARTRGNVFGRNDEAVWDLTSIDVVRVGERTDETSSRSDSDGLNVIFYAEIVLKDEHSFTVGPPAAKADLAQHRVDEINHFLHRWQRTQ